MRRVAKVDKNQPQIVDAIRKIGVDRHELETLAETVGIARTDSAKLGNNALVKRTVCKINPKLPGDKSPAYYSAALDMARSTRLDSESGSSAPFWKRMGEENTRTDSESTYVRTI